MELFQLRFVIRRVLLLSVTVAFLLTTGPVMAEDDVESPHVNESKGYCVVCHPLNDERLMHGNIGTCTICHRGNISGHPVVGHPINQVVRISTPSPLTLTSDKRIVCSTCHDPHARSGFEKYLRVELKLICVQCHRDY